MSKYVHTDTIHNSDAAQIIVPMVLRQLEVKSVVDFGCGLGNFLKVFKQNGVQDVLGLDGSWTDTERLSKNIDKDEFREVDLEQPIHLSKTYDLVLSLEVAEHLSPESELDFVASLVAAGDTILFSAAIPNQGGQNHINEKWLSEWAMLFKNHGFVPVDLFRERLWNDQRIHWWYRQNMILFVHKDSSLASQETSCLDKVHPALFERAVTQLQEAKLTSTSFKNKLNKEREAHLRQRKSPKAMFKLLIKSIFNR